MLNSTHQLNAVHLSLRRRYEAIPDLPEASHKHPRWFGALKIVRQNSYGLKPVVFMIVLLLFIAAPVSSAAQSTDRDRPSPLRSAELSVDFSQDDPEYFYSFVAGPGEVVFTLDVKGAPPGGGVPYFHLFDTDGRQLDSFDKFAAPDSSEKLVKRVSFAKRQTVILRISKPIGRGSYRLRISGAAALEKGATDESSMGDERMGLPASGTLRIEMNDGSAQEIDLRRIRRVVVKP